MYDYVDRPVAHLDRSPRLLVWAMRRWMRTDAATGCAMRAIATTFQAYGLDCALPHFKLATTVLGSSMRENPERGSATDARDISGRIVHLGGAPHLADALRQLALRLFARDLLCAAPEDGSGGPSQRHGGANDMGNT